MAKQTLTPDEKKALASGMTLDQLALLYDDINQLELKDQLSLNL